MVEVVGHVGVGLRDCPAIIMHRPLRLGAKARTVAVYDVSDQSMVGG